jgi:hypothetical protein
LSDGFCNVLDVSPLCLGQKENGEEATEDTRDTKEKHDWINAERLLNWRVEFDNKKSFNP